MWFCLIGRSFRCGDQSYHHPILRVIINRHGWLATWVVLWPAVSKTWTMCMFSGMGIDSAFVVIVVSSWSDILCPMHVNEMWITYGTIHDAEISHWEGKEHLGVVHSRYDHNLYCCFQYTSPTWCPIMVKVTCLYWIWQYPLLLCNTLMNEYFILWKQSVCCGLSM